MQRSGEAGKARKVCSIPISIVQELEMAEHKADGGHKPGGYEASHILGNKKKHLTMRCGGSARMSGVNKTYSNRDCAWPEALKMNSVQQ